MNSTKDRGWTQVEQEVLTLPEHLGSLPVLCGVHVAQYLVVYVVFC